MAKETWQPVSRSELDEILRVEVEALAPGPRGLWDSCRVEPRSVAIERYGSIESVFVVAQRNGEAIYYEDVEEGFNVSPVGEDGGLLQHWCNQDTLGMALNRLLDPVRRRAGLLPAE